MKRPAGHLLTGAQQETLSNFAAGIADDIQRRGHARGKKAARAKKHRAAKAQELAQRVVNLTAHPKRRAIAAKTDNSVSTSGEDPGELSDVSNIP